MIVPINITGGTYRDKSLPLSAQITRNFWPQLQQNTKTRSPYVLKSFPGKKVFGTAPGLRDRGMKFHLGVLYKVTDTTLYTVSSSGTHTSIGTIPGSARCIIDGIGTSIVIVTEGIPYLYDGSTLTVIDDSDLETPNSVAHLNSKIIYDGDDGRFWVSDVGNAANIGSLNYASAESNADDLKRCYVFDERLYLLGDVTTEIWWDSGVGIPSLDRVEQNIIEIGLLAIHAVGNTNDFMYFLGNDNQLYAAKGSNAQPVFPHAIVKEIKDYNIQSDAILFTYNLENQWMVQVTFPNANKTFVYPEGGEVFELSSGNDGGRDRANSYAFAFNKHLVGDHQSGNIYELDYDTYDENGEVVIRTRDTAMLHGELISPSAAGKELVMNSFELTLETGTGTLAGQGRKPQVMLSWSDDGGKTFSTEFWDYVGEMGQFQRKVKWYNLGSFTNRILRVSVSDPTYWAIFSAVADIEVGI